MFRNLLYRGEGAPRVDYTRKDPVNSCPLAHYSGSQTKIAPTMNERASASLENTTLAKYQIIKQIGNGSMGTVYLGHDPFIDRPVAIKVAHHSDSASEKDIEVFRQLFFNEAQAAGMLKHPNITSIFDAGVDGEVYYIVMEYVHGGQTLENYCAVDNLFSIDQLVRVVYKCATALDYAHKKGVIHRDIKPRNILLTTDNDVKISDFGIAIVPEDPETRILQHAGSPLYMSPEQIKQQGVSPQSDLFSLGVVMYELLTGKHPFSGTNIEAVNHMILHTSPIPIGELRLDAPEVLLRIVDRALARDLKYRYKSGLDFAGDLSLVFDFLEPSKEEITRQEKFNSLRALDFFRDFSDTEIWEIIGASVWAITPPGEDIILEGEVDKSFYIIISGSVDVSKGGTYVDVLAGGDCFGEMGFVSGMQRTATIRAREAVTIMKIHSTLIDRASINCQLRFHKLFLHTLIERLSRATDRIAAMDGQRDSDDA